MAQRHGRFVAQPAAALNSGGEDDSGQGQFGAEALEHARRGQRLVQQTLARVVEHVKEDIVHRAPPPGLPDLAL